MFDLPAEVHILNVAKNVRVKAQLIRLTRDLAAKGIDGTWWNLPVSKSVREEEGDNHWLWRKIVGSNHAKLTWQALAVQSTSSAIEGAITYRIDAKSQLQPGEGAVYVDRIAAAPRNRPWIVKTPKYQGIGSVLLLAAVRHSYLLGLGGRVWLTSLPSERTRKFYRDRGFEVIFEEADGMIGFELPSAAAEEWLKKRGFL
jgi:GNAT superfamily N-acetyltransferase